MRITKLEPIILRAEVDPTRADGTQDAFLLRVHTDEGLVGLGEADTSPYLAAAATTMPSSHSIAMGFADLLIDEDPLDIDRLWWKMFTATEHYGAGGVVMHLISAVDMALWDLLGQVLGKPIHELMGGRDPEPVRVYASEVMPDGPEGARELAEQAIADGYTALKLGWGPLGRSLESDLALIEAARSGLGPDAALMIDGGRAYSVAGAAGLTAAAAPYELFWLEEPLRADDLEGYRRLSERASTRIATGEADWGVDSYARLVAAGVDVLQPDLARCGGFTVGRGLIELARRRGVDVVPHCFSTGVLVAASLHLVAALPRQIFSEFSVAGSALASTLTRREFVLDDGRLEVPRAPGLGVTLDEEALERFRVELW